MFAAQIITRRHGFTAFVGTGETQEEAMKLLRESWLLDCSFTDPDMSERVANALFDDIVNGDDAEWEIHVTATA